MLEFPQIVFREDDLLESVLWCLAWLERHKIEGGWPEVAGINDASIHQTTLAVLALSRLRDSLLDFGSEYEVHGSTTVGSVLERVRELIAHGVRGYLYHRRRDGSWGWRTYVDTASSPSKTSLCLLATSAAIDGNSDQHSSINGDSHFEVGGVTSGVESLQLREVIAGATQWLLRNHVRWETLIEDDKDVQGTSWNHMAYALCVHAALEGGANPYDSRLKSAWSYMGSLWDAESKIWAERGVSGRNPTIRASYYTVCAYEQARVRLSDISMEEQSGVARSARSNNVDDGVKVTSVRAEGNEKIVVETVTGDRYECVATGKLLKLIQLLLSDPRKPHSRQQLAREMAISVNSVPKYVQRLNDRITDASDGRVVQLIRSKESPEGRGYQILD
ncbi:hypothetical protein [Amycolatopsis iheyensis]|uniref:hypothetical protein n=1 Tax=Amycolatopsis iheyensis TaxID=2945988 RepID=UPI00215331CA|nr:hypothetical protein [Amycolatopsis iheyensis]